MTRETLLALAAKVEALAGPCRETDAEIEWTVRGVAGRPYIAEHFSGQSSPVSGWWYDVDNRPHKASRYTGTWEAAYSLLPPDMQFIELEIAFGTDGSWPAISARWYEPGTTDPKHWMAEIVSGKTPAICLVNAALHLRARQIEHAEERARAEMLS